MSQTTTLVVRKQLPGKATLKMNPADPVLQPRWYFGGFASAGACCCKCESLQSVRIRFGALPEWKRFFRDLSSDLFDLIDLNSNLIVDLAIDL